MAKKTMPKFLLEIASDKQKALLKSWGISFEEDIKVIEFKNLRREHLSKVAPSTKQVEFLKGLMLNTTIAGIAIMKDYREKHSINAYVVEILIDIAMSNQKPKQVEEKDFSDQFNIEL